MKLLIQRTRNIVDILNSLFVDRNTEIEAIITALIARVNTLLIGPPGTAKTTLFRVLRKFIDAKFFIVSLDEHMSTEMILGPVNPKKYREEGILTRNFEEYLPGADIAVIDELFRMPPAVSSAIMPIMSDGVFFDGWKMREARTWVVFATTNFVVNNKRYRALIDRFPLRLKFGRVPISMIKNGMRASLKIEKILKKEELKPILSMSEIKQLHEFIVNKLQNKLLDKISETVELYVELKPEIWLKHSNRTMFSIVPRLIATRIIIFDEDVETAANNVLALLANGLPSEALKMRKRIENEFVELESLLGALENIVNRCDFVDEKGIANNAVTISNKLFLVKGLVFKYGSVSHLKRLSEIEDKAAKIALKMRECIGKKR